MNLALYRKYRPQNFSEVIGQEHIVQTLKNSSKENKIAQAYLFFGPRGTGKTSFARILSKAVNCSSLKDGDPCNKCPACESINKQQALDVVEIDAASNTGVDNIRDLIDGIKFNPTNLNKKVFIIDEVHMLSKGAFNALLKTLEEPPAHALFILATTEVEKVPETILSRVQRFDVKKLTLNQIIDKLTYILKKEKIKIDKDALKIIALLAEGGLRDAESILNRILSEGNKHIKREDVEKVVGISGFNKVFNFFEILAEKDLKKVILFLNKIKNSGIDLTVFLKDSMRYARNLLFLKISIDLSSLVAEELTQEQIKVMIEQSNKFSEDYLKKILSELLSAESILKNTSLPILPIELAVMNVFYDK